MNQQSRKVQKLSLYGSKEGNDVSVLVDAKVAVEKRSFVATGIVTYVLGEIIEVELPQFDEFGLGEQVKLMIYSRGGMFVFESTVIAKHNGALMILNPPENRRRFNDKREHPRVEVACTGTLHAMLNPSSRQEWLMPSPVEFTIDNMSMGGLGLMLTVDLGISRTWQLDVQLDLGFVLPCGLEIIRIDRSASSFYYGASFRGMPQEQASRLRAFILKRQIEAHYEQKHRIVEIGSEEPEKLPEEAPNAIKGSGMHILKASE
ncbi:PilZ domain-containing protein [Paenibacillus daejeonensis]|uniref:PilZ domain-containing protein n=1 Tax=Paenibacillus daejeonensis TaxID=135193 RepID=UPI0003823179|nr:PilZ domain-containing protein [Paenibacillus daejeonensis]